MNNIFNKDSDGIVQDKKEPEPKKYTLLEFLETLQQRDPEAVRFWILEILVFNFYYGGLPEFMSPEKLHTWHDWLTRQILCSPMSVKGKDYWRQLADNEPGQDVRKLRDLADKMIAELQKIKSSSI